MANKMVNWSDLQPELLEDIALRVHSNSIIDYVRSSLVCKPWKSVFRRKPIRKSLPLIMEILPENTMERGNRCRFFSIEGNVLRQFDHPCVSYLDERMYKGCGFGWVVVTDRNTYKYDDENDFSDGYEEGIYLMNPITRQEINLPSLATLVEMGRMEVINAVISSRPSLENAGDDCTVTACAYSFTNEKYVLICCRLGDDKWNNIQNFRESASRLPNNLAYYEGVLYAWEKFEGVVICDVNHFPPQVRSNVKMPELFGSDDDGFSTLVESSGELLQIRWYYDFVADKLLKLVVLRLEKNNLIWVEVKSLGDRVIFRSRTSSISLLASDHPGLKPNCVYFCRLHLRNDNNNASELRWGTFCLTDCSIEYLKKELVSPCLGGFWMDPSW